jgi:hypothetical protein
MLENSGSYLRMSTYIPFFFASLESTRIEFLLLFTLFTLLPLYFSIVLLYTVGAHVLEFVDQPQSTSDIIACSEGR